MIEVPRLNLSNAHKSKAMRSFENASQGLPISGQVLPSQKDNLAFISNFPKSPPNIFGDLSKRSLARSPLTYLIQHLSFTSLQRNP